MIRYGQRVFQVVSQLQRGFDPRARFEISQAVTLFVLFMGFLMRVTSLEQLERMVQAGEFAKWVPRNTRLPSVDTMRRILSGCDVPALHESLTAFVRKAIRNKAFRGGTIGGLVVAAVDGTELFASTAKQCAQCLHRTHDGVTQWFHRMVVCSIVGAGPRLVLGMRMQRPREGWRKQEGELTAATALLRDLYTRLHHFADVLVMDALYVSRPILEMVKKELHMDMVIRVKQETYTFVQDALGLMRRRAADLTFEVREKATCITVQGWQEFDLLWEPLGIPLRFLWFEEIHTPQGARSARKAKRHKMWVVTTLGREVSAQVVWEIMHARWDLENSGFHQLTTYHHLNHCYLHHEVGTEAWVLLMLLAYNLWQMFLYRHVRGFVQSGMAIVAVWEAMMRQWARMRRSQALYLWGTG